MEREVGVSESGDGTLSLSEFARYKGWRPSYVTELKLAGRLVLTDTGRVQVRESLARIEQTQDPSKSGVAERHAAERAAKVVADAAVDSDASVFASAGHNDSRVSGDDDSGGSRYQRARAANEQYKALQAKLDYEVRIGKLVDAAQVRAAAADMGATVRRRLESLAPLVSAQIDERDRDRVYTQITDIVEQTLADLERVFSRGMARKESA